MIPKLLAAASLDRLLIDEILPAMTSNLHLLNSTRRDLPRRQRTLQAVFDYSWELLEAREQALLAQISIFRGGFTRQAAGAVIIGSSAGLYNLQHHAPLQRDETGRFRIHPLLRQLAGEKLNSPPMSEIAALALQRHSVYFANFMQSFAADLRRGVGQKAIQTIRPEQANLRAAWQHAVQTGQWATIADCLAGTHYFYKRTGLFSEEALLIDGAVSVLQAAMEPGDEFMAALLSRLFTIRAAVSRQIAHFKDGIKAAKQACELAQRLEDRDLEGQARLAWGRILATQHKRDQALAQFEQVVALARTARNQFLEADGLIGIGEQLVWQADVRPAQKPLDRALILCRSLPYKLGEMETLRFLGQMKKGQEAYAASAEYHNQALALSRLLGDVAAEAEELGSLGVVKTLQGDLPGSQRYEEEALATFRRLNMTESVQWLLGELGYTALRLGNFAKAEKLLNEALATATRLEDKFWQGWVMLRLGALWQERGEAKKGLPLIIEAFETAEQFNYLNFKAAVLYDWGNVLLSQEDWAGAQQKFQEAYDLRQGLGRTEQALPALAGLAYVACQRALPETAAAHAEQLWQTWQASPQWAERADLKLYWWLALVWDGLRDSRAKVVWKRAHALLYERCEQIPDEDARKMFLEQVPVNRAISEAL